MLESLFRKLSRKTKISFDAPTEQDLYYCYRLFFKREPDEFGWETHLKLIKNKQITLQALTDGFLYSPELQELQDALNKPQLVDLETFKMYIRRSDSRIGNAIFTHKNYEPHVTQKIKQLLKPGDTMIDIGANIGYFTLLASAIVGETGKIIAFEPRTANCELIKMSIAENGFHNIVMYPYAVSKENGTMAVEFAAQDSNSRMVAQDNISQGHKSESVKVVTLDSFLANTEKMDLIKMDIEGAEPLAWQGMAQLIETHRPIVLTEFFPDYLDKTSQMSPQDYLTLMQDKNYKMVILKHDGSEGPLPTDIQTMLTSLEEMGHTHFDLVAYPQ